MRSFFWLPKVIDLVLSPKRFGNQSKNFLERLLLALWFAKGFIRWQIKSAIQHPKISDDAKLTVVLLSYNRVFNMQPIVESILKVPFVEKIVVSNNNPRIRIREWVTIQDKRVELIDQTEPTNPGIRFSLAKERPSEFYFAIDDDVFLTPNQIKLLFHRLRENPVVPHGIQGDLCVSEMGGTEKFAWRGVGYTTDWDGPVDVLNCVYAFTREHLDKLFQLAKTISIDVDTIRNGEDILLSFSGKGKPLCHNLGAVTICPTSIEVGTSTWISLENFDADRFKFFFKLQQTEKEMNDAKN